MCVYDTHQDMRFADLKNTAALSCCCQRVLFHCQTGPTVCEVTDVSQKTPVCTDLDFHWP